MDSRKTSVRFILIDAKAGSDSIKFTSTLTISTKLYQQQGNDTDYSWRATKSGAAAGTTGSAAARQ